MTILAYLLIAFAAGVAVGRAGASRFAGFQNRGERTVSRAIRANFASSDFHLLNHVTLRLADGTTQVDHILVSRVGVFVIETKEYSGWIFGDAQQRNWTQVIFRQKFKFQNPLHQNHRHASAVRALLDFMPASVIRPVVVFVGTAEFKTDVPEAVFTLDGLVKHLRGLSEKVISANRVQFSVGRLEMARLEVSRLTDVEHVEDLRRRHGGA